MMEIERKEDGTFKKGQKPWNYGKVGCFSVETRAKMSESRKGRFDFERSSRWRGGRCLSHEYIIVRVKDHPHANCDGYVREHRLVMEKHLGRFLLPGEVVHHVNENKTDNRIENLKLFKNKTEHLLTNHAWKTRGKNK